MRQLILFFALVFYFNFCFSQGTPYTTYQQFGSQTTLTDFKGAARGVKGIIIGRYADTATANLGSIDFYPGAQIITDSPLDVLWQRNHNATAWLEMGTSITTNVTNIFESLTDCYGLLNPGVVSWSQLLIFDVSPADYIINCNDYSSSQTQITLDAAHSTLNRIDVIYVDTLGLVGKLTGTPAADPAKPQVDPSSQLELTSILILAGATTPSGVAGNVIYDQNTGSPEWPGTATGVTVGFGNTTNPFHLTIAADVGAFTAGQSFRWVKSSGTESINDYGLLKFYIRIKSTFSNQAMLTLDWMNGTTSVSSTVNLASGQFGFTRTTVGSYQIITIPLSAWNFTSDNVNTLRITLAGSNANGFYIDWVQLQSGITQNPTVFPNGFGVMQTPSGAAVSTQPNDIATYVGAGNISITATGKTVTWTGTSSSSTVSIVNDSSVQVCTPQGVCSTYVISNVPIQQVFIVDYNTLLVCNTAGTVCDTFDVSIPQFFDRGFFDPNQASFTNTLHTMNGNDLRLIGGTLDINDDGLAITTRSVITPLQAVNDHTDLNNVKIGVIAARRVAGNGAAGLGIGYRTDIDNSASTQTIAANMTTEWATATAGSETATTKFWTVSGGTLASRLQIEGSTRIIADGIRFQEAEGADVTAANDLPLGNGGNAFVINGNTTINGVIITNWQGGSKFGFKTTGTPLFKHNTAGGAGTVRMFLAGSVDFQAAAGDYIEFRYIDGELHESNRKLAATGGVYTFRSGLTESPATIVELGGTLLDLTTITALGANSLIVTGDVAPFSANATTGIGVGATATSGFALTATATTGIAASFLITPAGTTDIQPSIYVKRNSSGTPAAGMGGSIDFWLESTLFERLSSRIASVYTDATDATRTAELQFWTTNSATSAIKATLAGTGQWRFHPYGAGTFTAGTAIYLLATTSDGTVIEYPSGGLSGGLITANNGLTMSTATNVQLGGTLINATTTIDAGTNLFVGTSTFTDATVNSAWRFNNTLNTASLTFGLMGTAAGTNASGAGVVGFHSGSGIGVYGNSNSTGIGVQGTSSSGQGIGGTSTSGLGGSFRSNTGIPLNANDFSTAVNTTTTILQLSRIASGTPTLGIAGRIILNAETDAGDNNAREVADIVWTWTDIALATRTGELQFWTTNSATSGLGLTLTGNKRLILTGRLETIQGADVASVAGAIAVGFDGNKFELTGTNAVTLISNLGWVNGNEITFYFTGAATLTDGTANSGTDIGMELAGNANFVGSADDVLTLELCEIGGTQRWREKSRSVN